MRITETIETDAGAVTVRELTVGEIRAWLAGLAARAATGCADVVGELLVDGFPLDDLPLFMGEHIGADALTQSELAAVIAAARRLNADFFGLRGRLLAAGRQMPTPPSATLSAPSSS